MPAFLESIPTKPLATAASCWFWAVLLQEFAVDKCRADVSGHYAFRGRGTSAIHRRNGVDQPLRRFADFAGVSEALDSQRRIAGRRCGESFHRRRMARRAAL